MNKLFVQLTLFLILFMSCEQHETWIKDETSPLNKNPLEKNNNPELFSEKENNEPQTQFKLESQIGQKQLMISSAQFSPSTEIVIEGCEFDLVKNGDEDTVYLSTNDTKFLTPEGYKVGDHWKTIDNKDKINLSKMPGWGYYIKLESN